MKKLVIMVVLVMVVAALSAQHRVTGHYGSYYRPRTRVVVGVGAGYYPWYNSYPYGYMGYPYGYPMYGRPSGLELKIQDIKADYQDRIWSARHDKSVPRRERRKEIHQLKSERDAAIRDAERNYHRRAASNY